MNEQTNWNRDEANYNRESFNRAGGYNTRNSSNSYSKKREKPQTKSSPKKSNNNPKAKPTTSPSSQAQVDLLKEKLDHQKKQYLTVV